MQHSINKILFNHLKKIQKQCVNFSSTTFQSLQPKSQTGKNESVKVYGQPTAQTHPHLLKFGELLPGLCVDEFKQRRKKLVESVISEGYVGKTSDKHVLIVPSSSKVYMSDKIPYVFRQNTDFLYFTGCQEPDSVLVVTTDGGSSEATLFVQNKNEKSELWDGPRTGVEAASDFFAVDRSLPISDFETFITSFINKQKNNCNVWYENREIVQLGVHQKLAQVVKTTNLKNLFSPKTLLHKIRLIKSEAEINLMRKSCEIASESIQKTIELAKPGMTEHQVFATVDYECRIRGAEFLAYPPVVASGNNANIVHYITNNQVINDGNLVLMDAGCEYHGYSSDITRTWPISGTFTDPQRVLYEIVLEVQKVLINRLADFPTLDMLFHEMCSLLGKKLQEGGLIPKTMNGSQLIAAAYLYCPHHVSHYLGMDVHDTGRISRGIRTQPGMIVTVEPGVYINSKNQLAPPEFRGLGIRIEDDVLVTESGPVILTQSCPKEIADIEALAKLNQS